VPEQKGTVALGAGLLAASLGLWLSFTAVERALAAPTAIQPSHCQLPIEVVEQGTSRLDCDPASAFAACGILNTGDRVSLVNQDCYVERGGMRAEMRLVAELPLLLNKVSTRDLALLDGIGPSLSAAIIKYRDHSGPFEQVDELLAVRGIGKKRLKRLRRHLSCAKP